MKQPVGWRRRVRLKWFAYLHAWRSWSVLEGLVGTVLITAGSLTPAYLPLNSPWWSRLNEAGLRGSTWRIVGTLLVLVGVGLLVDSWLRLRPGREPRDVTAEPVSKHVRRYFNHRPGIRAGLHPWAVLGVWGLPFLLAPPIFSHDAYSYAAQGWLLENDISPYEGYPGLLPGAFADQVAQEWRYTKTPYGPLALTVQHWIVHLNGDNPYWSAVFMRVPALLGVIAIGLLLSRVARRVGRDPHFTAWFSTLNPILVVDFIGGAHNDALMMGLVVIGLWVACLTSWSWTIGAVLVGGAAAVKQPAFMVAVALPLIRHPMTSWHPRRLVPALGRAVGSLVISVAVFAGISWASGLGFGWYHAVDVPGMVLTVSPFTLVGMGIRMVLGSLGAHQTAAAVIPIAQAIGVLVGAFLLVVLAVRLLPRKALSFLALGFLAVALCAPALHSWYVLWGALLLPLIDEAARFVRPAVWITVILLSFDAVNLSWRNSAAALGVALVLVLAARLVWHEHSLGQGWTHKDVHVPRPHKAH